MDHHRADPKTRMTDPEQPIECDLAPTGIDHPTRNKHQVDEKSVGRKQN
ncbi:hypothetical protein OAM04_00470 [bacterium]|nr:hypothetical protein [bacterium]